ncbi:regulator of G-protein signaling 6-like [Sardina pilchardus]|uniref:regulator of G-protein signaling 6-like n=1 Tax=Sardina pilchardus TaxID=27697 RepID=UPI002E160D4F
MATPALVLVLVLVLVMGLQVGKREGVGQQVCARQRPREQTGGEPGLVMAEASPEQQPTTGVTGAAPAPGATGATGATDPDEDSPNMIVYRKIEDIVTRIQDETEGVPIRTVKSFLSKIPSVVTGADIVQWLMKNLNIDDPAEAIHIGSLVAAQGYIFPISDHVLTLKDDGTFYRFQAPYFWPSNCWEPENTDYAIYLCKRTMQNKTRLELADYEAENLARLQRAFARKWEFIFMQAEAQLKIDRKKDKNERKILDSQERAFWDVHRPVPGCVNTTEMDIRKCRRMKNPQKVKKSVYGLTEDSQSQSPIHTPSLQGRKDTKDDVKKEILFLNSQLDRHCMKVSKVAETLMGYTEQYLDYDPFLTTPEPSNPWASDDPSFWDLEASKDPSQQRVRKWGFSLDEALKDPAGRDQFLRFLESEFSSENLLFWLAVQDLKRRPLQEVAGRAQDIWQEFLAEGAPRSINLDSHSYERTSQNLKDPGRYSFEDAQDHIYKLMKSDSYARFLRSNAYQDLLLARKKLETTEQGRRTSLEKFTRSVGKSLTGKRLTGLMQSS